MLAQRILTAVVLLGLLIPALVADRAWPFMALTLESRNCPSLRSSLLMVLASESAMGATMAARAVLLGVAGARIKSATARQ